MICNHDYRFKCGKALNKISIIAKTGTVMLEEYCCWKHTSEYKAMWQADAQYRRTHPYYNEFLFLDVEPITAK